MSKRRSIDRVGDKAKVVARSSAFPVTEERHNEGRTNWE